MMAITFVDTDIVRKYHGGKVSQIDVLVIFREFVSKSRSFPSK